MIPLAPALSIWSTDLVLEEEGVGDGGDVNRGSRQAMLDHLGDAGAHEPHGHLRAGRSDQCVGDLFRRPAAGGRCVYLHDAVAFLNAGRFRRCVREYLNHGDDAVLVLDPHSDPAVPAGGVRGEALKLLRRQELRVWIVELFDEAARRFLVQGGVVQGVDEPIGDERENLVEEPGAIARSAILQDEPADEGGRDDGCDQSELAEAIHGTAGRGEGATSP
jgi:hypothetical protein